MRLKSTFFSLGDLVTGPLAGRLGMGVLCQGAWRLFEGEGGGEEGTIANQGPGAWGLGLLRTYFPVLLASQLLSIGSLHPVPCGPAGAFACILVDGITRPVIVFAHL